MGPWLTGEKKANPRFLLDTFLKQYLSGCWSGSASISQLGDKGEATKHPYLVHPKLGCPTLTLAAGNLLEGIVNSLGAA